MLQASLRKTIRALEKQQAKFQKQAEEWTEHSTVSGHSQEACGAGLAGVKGQLELVRALREVHTQEVRQELAQFEAVSPRYCGCLNNNAERCWLAVNAVTLALGGLSFLHGVIGYAHTIMAVLLLMSYALLSCS